MKGVSMCALMAVAALFAGAACAESFTYGTLDAPVDSQTVALEADTVVDAVTAHLKPGAALTFAGGPLVFTADAPLKVDFGRIVIDAPSTLNGSVKVSSSAAESMTYGTDKTQSISTDASHPTTVFVNRLLSVWKPTKGTGNGGSGITDMTAYNVRRGDGWLEVQFQQRGSNVDAALKCIKVRFEQSGDDIVASLVYGRYCLYKKENPDPSHTAYGYDFDVGPNDGTYNLSSTYLYQVTMAPDVSGYEVAFRRPVTGASAVLEAVAGDVNVATLEGPAVTNEDGTISAKLVASAKSAAGTSSRVRVRNVPEVTLTGPVAGSYGTLEVERTADGNESAVLEDTVEVEIKDYAAANAYLNWTLVQEGALLKDLTNVVAKIAGRAIGGSVFEPPTNGSMGTFFFRNNGGSATAQVQWHPETAEGRSGTLKCLVLEFRQGAKGVEMRIAKSAYMQNSPYAKTGLDFFALPYGYSWGKPETSAAAAGYTCPYAKLAFRTGRRAMYRNVYAATLPSGQQTANTYSMVRGQYVVRGAEGRPILLSMASHLLGPQVGTVFAESNGVFQTSTNGQTKSALSYSLSVRPGGMLFMTQDTPSNHGAFSADGGIVMMGPEQKVAPNPDYGDITGYLGDIALSNGAVVAGWGFRCGFGFDQVTFSVGGVSPSLIDTPITFCSKGKYVMNDIVFDVADTTGDGLGTADLTVNGKVQVYSPTSGFDYMRLLKRGAGTLLLNGAYAPTNEVIVTEGAIKLGKCSLFGAKTKLRLNGGTFAGAADTTNTVGRLSIAASSSVALDAGTSLCLPEPAEWAEGATLSVTQGEGAVFRLGTSACLDEQTLKRVRVNGRHVIQNADGSFSPLGVVLIVR